MQANVDKGERQGISLQELNNRVKAAVQAALPETYWVRAEMSDVRTNVASGHCYLEFIEKDPQTGQLLAKARGSIWARTFRMLKPYFELETGQVFASGLKVLVNVSVEFHELYGYNLTVWDIDPAYTLGDMLRKRMEIIRQLKSEGVFELNKELPFPILPRRVAVISSPTAAGYGDFLNQLMHNKAGYPFYVKLFPAIMQGERTEESVIAALDRIDRYRDCFDVVVIIRGGGATSDLNSFDSYLLAANCAQFPLPIVTGIGHEPDTTIADMVADRRASTPTAAAESVAPAIDEVERQMLQRQVRLGRAMTAALEFRRQRLDSSARLMARSVEADVSRRRVALDALGARRCLADPLSSVRDRASDLLQTEQRLHDAIPRSLSRSRDRSEQLASRLSAVGSQIARPAESTLARFAASLDALSPLSVLARGYAIARGPKGGVVKDAAELARGDGVRVLLGSGSFDATVTKVNTDRA